MHEILQLNSKKPWVLGFQKMKKKILLKLQYVELNT